MANRPRTLNDGSRLRKQVELNLNPVSIQPTINNGGNYRVAVQQTPKTNSALQLAEALKQGVQVYGQGVKIAQDKATKDVESMSEADFDKFLTEGLDEESRSIFGYTKAYNQALAKKYYAEEMPTKLQAIAAELHKDPYAYKDPAQFEGAAIAAVNEAYDEADELLGGNVFSEQANNALKSATKSDFIAKQQATYLERQPQITRQLASEGAFNAFSKITKADEEAKAMIDAQIEAVTVSVGSRKEAAKIVTKAYLDNIEALAKQEGQAELAQELLDELDTGEGEGTAGLQGRRGFGADKVEIFNTAENRGRIEDLEDDIEKAGVSGYNAKIARARTAQAGIELEAFGLIAEAKGDETTALTRFEEIEADIRKGSVTLNGVDYTDTLELNEIRKFIAGARNNKDLFVHNAKLSFVQQNTGSKQTAVKQITSAGSIAKLNLEASKLLYVSGFDSEGRQSINLTPLGQTFISEFNSELEQLELGLADSLLSNTALSQGDKITEYSKLYPAEVTAKMQEWTINRLDDVVPDKTDIEMEAVDAGLSVLQQAQYKAIGDNTNLSTEEIRMSQEDFLTQNQARIESELFITGKDGSRELNTKGKVFKINPAIPYKKAIDNGFFKDSVEQSKALDVVFDSFTAMDGVNQPAKNSLIREFNSRLNFPNEDTVLQRSEKNANVRQTLSLNGVSLEEVANDSYRSVSPHYNHSTGINTPITLSAVYGTKSLFTSTPVLIDGSITNTVRLVESYFFDKENTVLPENIKKAAKAHGISVGHMMVQMNAYLTDNNFLKK